MTKAKPTPQDFTTVFERLRGIMAKHAAKLMVQTDEPGNYYLNTAKMYNGHPVCFGMVRVGKNYVSYHLMPVYGCAELREEISDDLRRRMQGKACFNFRKVDEKLFKELAQLTKHGLQRFEAAGFVSCCRVRQAQRRRTEHWALR